MVGVHYATAHMHYVIVGRYFFKKLHRYIVCCTWCIASSLAPLMYLYKGIHDVM